MNTFNLSFVAILLLFLCFNLSEVYAQVSDKGLYVRVQVLDDDDNVVEHAGYISEGTNREYLHLITRSREQLTIPFSAILTMESKRGIELGEQEIKKVLHPDDVEEEEDEYAFRERGLYAVLGTEFNHKTDGNFEIHPAIDLAIGYKFNRMLALGIGGSIRSWTYDVWPNAVAHIYAEARGWFIKRGNSPYYRFKLGYGNSWQAGEGNFQSSKGGLHYAPAIGIRLINSRVMNLNLETGFNHQEITYEDLDFGSFQRKYSFNRHYIAISMMY